MWIISQKCRGFCLLLITVLPCYADKDVRSGSLLLHSNISWQLEWFIIVHQNHPSALICIKDITSLLAIWNIFTSHPPCILHNSSFVTCSLLLLPSLNYSRVYSFTFLFNPSLTSGHRQSKSIGSKFLLESIHATTNKKSINLHDST